MRQRLTDTRSWTMQCRISMYWYSSQQLSTVVSSGFCWLCHSAEGRPSLSHPGPLSFHHERCDDTPRERISLSCSDETGRTDMKATFQLPDILFYYIECSTECKKDGGKNVMCSKDQEYFQQDVV